MRARYIEEVGTIGHLRVYWDEVLVDGIDPCSQCPAGHPKRTYLNGCPNAYGGGKPGGHRAVVEIGRVTKLEQWGAFGKESDYEEGRWPTACSHCGAPVPGPPSHGPEAQGERGFSVNRTVDHGRLYNTASGRPESGDVYELKWHEPGKCPWWDNCGGVHWHGVLPNGYEWDMDSRASNCTLREDRTHRCWVRTGSAELGTLSAGKGGVTCSAGAGSIAAPGWHGFLTNFDWVSC